MTSIYNYQDPASYLSDYLKDRLKGNDLTLKEWSKEAGFETTAAIVDVLKGKKNLSASMLTSLVDKIGLDPSEYIYFTALVAKRRSTSHHEKELYDFFLNELSPKNQFIGDAYYECKRFEDSDIFSHWIFTTILSLAALKNFDLTAVNIQENLRESLPVQVIEAALDRLVQLELLMKNEKGEFVPSYQSVTSKTNVKSSEVTKYFHQMADLSKNAIEVSLDKREFHSFSIPVEVEKIPLAKEIIRKCRANLASLMSKNGNAVYQINLNLFPLTKEKSEVTAHTCKAL
jgi:uncharacterized protein (TIGR02147 family)